jgi:hypothetical protein
MDKKCKCGKKIYDKKGAVSMSNLTMKLHHIKMRPYKCPFTNHWHLATEGNHRKFRHN